MDSSSSNVTMTVKENILIIEVDLSRSLGPSSSGKSMLIASTGGSAPVPLRTDIQVGLNVFKPTARR